MSLAYNNYKKNLNVGVFRPLKHKPTSSPTTKNYFLG